MKNNAYDIAVVGAGHAGIEAAVAAASLGMKTALVTLDKNKIGLMSCNPAIGGLAKGQLAREVDALGGVMGKITDASGIHFKMLNRSKGPAVQSPRAQVDRKYYAAVARNLVEQTANLTIIEDMGIGVDVKNNRVEGLRLKKTGRLSVRAVVLTAGTFLNGLIFVGLKKLPAGRAGDLPAVGMTESLIAHGFKSGRLKTGTPPRIHRDSIDYSKVEPQKPDKVPQPFSFSTKKITRRQIDCYITYTNPETHNILRLGFDRSPMFTGMIKGVGPRYCPSIEDKINRFADRDRHQIFLEPEGYHSKEVYVNGYSTGLPADIQERSIKTIAGLEKAKIVRLGYSVEYDFFPPNQLKATLETRGVDNLYFAGQINGTSGYEEAAAQGLMAGLNAALKLKHQEAFILERSQAYIGVLIDDLITKTHDEPYRMFTSMAEFRLLLRQDNADLRLMEQGRKFGLIDDITYKRFLQKKTDIERLYKQEMNKTIDVVLFNERFAKKTKPLRQAQPLRELVKRPGLSLKEILTEVSTKAYLDAAIAEVEFSVKYEGYVQRQQRQVEKIRKLEEKKIPEGLDYNAIKSLSTEAREKLNMIRPANLGQASRISGVRSADLSVLILYLEKYKT